MATLLPYKTEYAKSGRASCKSCKNPIDKGELRLAQMVKSGFHDGRDARWFHAPCFFQKFKPASVGDIEDFESIRYEDQQMIKNKMGAAGSAGASNGSGKGKKADAADAMKDFAVGYAKSGRSACAGCEGKIENKELRLSKKDYTSEKAVKFASATGMDRWHHVDCFVKIRDDLEFFADAKDIPGFKDLEREDQAMLKKKLPAIKESKRKLDTNGDSAEGSAAKKIKTEPGVKAKSAKSEEDAIMKQNKQMYKNRDAAEAAFKKAEILQILRFNKQDAELAPKEALDLLADIMTFGAMKRCTDCEDGQFMYKSGVGYLCTGFISEFTKCNYALNGDVERVPFKVPLDFKEHALFAGKSFKVTKRVIPKHAAPVKGVAPSATSTKYEGPKIVKNPLAGFKFAILGVSSKEESKKIEETIKKFGGKISSRCSGSLAAAITPKDTYDDSSKNIAKAKKHGVPVVSTEFVDNIKDVKYKLAEEMSKYLLSDWVKDVRARLKTLNEEFEKPREEESKIKKMILKDGAVVDPDSGLDDGPYHVYKEGNLFFNSVLNRTSVEDGLNSFYKIQIIESDQAPKRYYVFRAWGRIGTTVGGHQTDPMSSKQEAVDLFMEKYEEKSGNIWGPKFVKKPGRYIRLDIDYGQDSQQKMDQKLVPSAVESQLPLPVQTLIALIFDVDTMRRTMMEFEIDMVKMPLGKISRKQLLEAYSVLSESFNLKEKEKDERKLNRMIQDVTNRFFTLIPHNFGIHMPPLLDNEELLKSKIEMLDNLMEIEIAYDLIAKGEKCEGSSRIDSHYKTLKADIDLLEAQSEEFKVIQKYLENTHAPTHSNYSLELEQVYKVVRSGENKRYRPFKDLHNRRLLWHGSRVSNFAGIISQGLRIAPPEAPATGYMFGKGIYFADMVTKSANYCFTSRGNSTGLLLLCEVALGDMHELKDAKDITKPPKGAHSVKGIGGTEPDPKDTFTFPDGVMVPYGKPTKAKTSGNSSLLYNEYIVYDVAQVNIKYLLKVNFNYDKRGRN